MDSFGEQRLPEVRRSVSSEVILPDEDEEEPDLRLGGWGWIDASSQCQSVSPDGTG